MLMNDYLLYGIVALIVIIVLAIVFTYIIKNRHPKQIKAEIGRASCRERV